MSHGGFLGLGQALYALPWGLIAYDAGRQTYVIPVGAITSQLGAAVADTIGSGELIREGTPRNLGVQTAFASASALAIAVFWMTDPPYRRAPSSGSMPCNAVSP